MRGKRIKPPKSARQRRLATRGLTWQIHKLEAERRQLEERIKKTGQEITLHNEGTRALIEEWVNAAAASIAEHETTGNKLSKYSWQEQPEIYDIAVRCKWRGVETPKQARELLTEEAVRRSVGKGDLALLLCSVDHTAVSLFSVNADDGSTMAPKLAALKEVPGDQYVEATIALLTDGDFAGTALMLDPRWVSMRGRWVRLGWHGATEATFDAVFIRAVAERMQEIQFRQDAHAELKALAAIAGDAGLPLLPDTILEEETAKVSPIVRTAMTKCFAERLTREYESLTSEVMTVNMSQDDAEKLNAIAAREGKTPGEVLAGYAADELKNLDAAAARAQQAISRTDTLLGEVDDALAGAEKAGFAAPRPDDVDAAMRAGVVFKGAYSDHEFMRSGRIAWEQTYALGMTDEEALDRLNRGLAATEAVHATALFTAKWAVHAFQRLTTSHTFAAALMCSDVQREVLEGIEKQWDAFMVIVPNGMLIGKDGIEFTRILVATYATAKVQNNTHMILLGPTPKRMRTPCVQSVSLPDLLAADESELEEPANDAGIDPRDRRCFVMAKRLVAGLLLNLQHPPNYKIRVVEERTKSLKRQAEPEHRIVTIGKPLEIDCRPAVKEYIEHGPKKGRKHSAPTVQVMVRGHYKRQVCGVGRLQRKVIWIEPFFRGPEAALIQTRPQKVRVTR